jgi:hypothetical protein
MECALAGARIMISDIIFVAYLVFCGVYAAVAYLPQFEDYRFEVFKQMGGEVI